MSATYPERTETNFPEQVDNLTRMSDLSFDDMPLVQQYYSYYNAGNITAANALLTANPSLKAKIFNAAKFNKLADGIGAVQEYFKNDLQTYLNEQLTYREPYNPNSTYSKTNIVDFNGEGFICRIDDVKGISPINGQTTETWAIISKRGIQGVSGTGLSPRGDWNASNQYYIDDFVGHTNCFWQCVTGNISSEPTNDNANWAKLANVGVVDNYIIATDVGEATEYSPIEADKLRNAVKVGNADFDGTKDIGAEDIGIPPAILTGITPPTSSTTGVVGQLYLDTVSEKQYQCVSAIEGVYKWVNITLDRSIALSPDVATALGLPGNPQVADALLKLAYEGYAFKFKVTTDGRNLSNVSIGGLMDKDGNPCITDTNGTAIGVSEIPNPTITVSGYADLQDYSETLTATGGLTDVVISLQQNPQNSRAILSSTEILFSRRMSVNMHLISAGNKGAYGTSSTAGAGGSPGKQFYFAGAVAEPDTTYPCLIGAQQGAVTTFMNKSSNSGTVVGAGGAAGSGSTGAAGTGGGDSPISSNFKYGGGGGGGGQGFDTMWNQPYQGGQGANGGGRGGAASNNSTTPGDTGAVGTTPGSGGGGGGSGRSGSAGGQGGDGAQGAMYLAWTPID